MTEEIKKENSKEALLAAQKVIQEAQTINIKKFEAKYIELCQEFGLEIQAQTNLVIVPIKK